VSLGRKLEREKEDPTVPTDSVADIAYLMIIFFILTTSIEKLSGFNADIPSAQQQQQQPHDAEKTPTLKLHPGGMSFNDQPIDLPGFRKALQEMKFDKRPEDKRVVVLDAAKGVDYQAYYEAMAAISAAGGIVGIMTEEPGR
jgi:biopolymer transport protein ExbD